MCHGKCVEVRGQLTVLVLFHYLLLFFMSIKFSVLKDTFMREDFEEIDKCLYCHDP